MHFQRQAWLVEDAEDFEPVCLVPESTGVCLCLSGVFAQASTYILRASCCADTGIFTNKIFLCGFHISAYVCCDLWPWRSDTATASPSNQQQAPQMVLQQLPAQQLFTIVNAASRMHINACSALRSQHNLECSYVCCAYHNTYDPGKSPGNSTSLGTCTQGPIYQGNLERILYLTPYLYKTGSDLSCAGRCVHTLGMRIWTQSDK